MFNFRIISVCLGRLGGSAGGGIGIGKRRPGMPLTSNLFRSGNPNCIFLWGRGLQDSCLYWSHFAFLNSSSSVWDGRILMVVVAAERP